MYVFKVGFLETVPQWVRGWALNSGCLNLNPWPTAQGDLKPATLSPCLGFLICKIEIIVMNWHVEVLEQWVIHSQGKLLNVLIISA